MARKEKRDENSARQRRNHENAIVSLSIITIDVNRLKSLTKRHREAEWIKNKDSTTCYLPGTHFRFKKTHRVKVKGWKKTFHANGNQEGRVAIPTADK